MSLVVLTIGAAHAAPPILGALIGRSRRGVGVGAAIGAFIAFASGSLAFVVVDLAGLLIGAAIALSMVKAMNRAARSDGQGARIFGGVAASIAKPLLASSASAGRKLKSTILTVAKWTLCAIFVFLMYLQSGVIKDLLNSRDAPSPAQPARVPQTHNPAGAAPPEGHAATSKSGVTKNERAAERAERKRKVYEAADALGTGQGY